MFEFLESPFSYASANLYQKPGENFAYLFAASSSEAKEVVDTLYVTSGVEKYLPVLISSFNSAVAPLFTANRIRKRTRSRTK